MAIRRPPTTFSDSITGADLASDIAISTTGNIATTGSGTLSVAGTTSLTGILSGGGGYRLNSIQTFDTAGSNTWTKPANVNAVLVYVTGAGGGGGAAGNAYDSGGGGGAGGTAIKWITSGLGATETVTIGAGGTGAGNDSSTTGQYDNGNSGGTSSFGSHCSATGGTGGYNGNAGHCQGGLGGVGSSGDINLNGEDGFRGQDTSNDWNWQGHGGSSFWGGAGDVNNYATNAASGSDHGSGGPGGSVKDNDASKIEKGSNGAGGFVVVWEYIG